MHLIFDFSFYLKESIINGFSAPLLGNTGWRRGVGNERLGAANRRIKPELQQSPSDKRNARRQASDQSKQRKREESEQN